MKASLEHISESLRPLARKTSTLKPDPKNARRHSERNIEAVMNSLLRFGQQKPIVALKSGTVIAGNGTLEAAQRLKEMYPGWEYVAVSTFENRRDAIAYGIADNKTAELADWDWEVLSEHLGSMEDELLKTTGFDADEVEAVLANSPWEGMPDDAVPPAQDWKGQKFIRIRILEDGAIEPVMADLKIMVSKYGPEKVEVVE